MRILPLFTGLALVSAGAVLGRALPQDDPSHADPSQPGPIHEAMASRAGDYSIATKMSMPGMDPMESSGTAKVSSVLGGRFLLEESSGTMMGQPYSGLRLWGFNNDTEELESVWTYTMSTGMLIMKGKHSEDGESIVCKASYTEGGETEEMDVVLTFPDDNSHVVTMTSEGPGGGQMKYTEVYTRKERGEK